MLIFTGTGRIDGTTVIFGVAAHNSNDAEDLARRHGMTEAKVKSVPDFPQSAEAQLLADVRRVFIVTRGQATPLPALVTTPEQARKRDAEITKKGRR